MTKAVLDCRRGRSLPTTAESPVHVGVAWKLTTDAAVLLKSDVAAMAERGELPAPSDLLLVRAHPGKAPGWSVKLEIQFASKPHETQEFPFLADPKKLDDEGAFGVAFAFVAGPEPIQDLALPTITLVDVTEGSSFAPRVLVSGLGAGPLPVDLGGGSGAGECAVQLVSALGAPLVGVPVSFDLGGEPLGATTDARGIASVLAGADGKGSASIADLSALQAASAAAGGTPGETPPPEGAVERDPAKGFEAVPVEAGQTVVVKVVGGTRCFDLPGPHFDFDRSFIRPDGMRTLGPMAAALEEDPSRVAMIFGHTDTVGDEPYNKRLSERRARLVQAALAHDVATWEAAATEEGWGLKMTQVMLNAVNDGSQPECPETGQASGAQVEAVKAFQRRADHEPLRDDGDPGPKTRKELTLLYLKLGSPTPVAPERFHRFGASPFMGCGERNPFTPAGRDEVSRRVEVLIFPPADAPPPPPCVIGSLAPCDANVVGTTGPDDKTPHFRCGVFRKLAAKCPVAQGSGAGEMIMTFVDEVLGVPLAKRSVLVEHPGGQRVTHETNAEGKIVISDAAPGTFKILEFGAERGRCRVDAPGA